MTRAPIKLISSMALAAAMAAGSAAAMDVTFTSSDLHSSVTGDLISFDGETYLVDTAFGIISVPAANAICEGEGCPMKPVAAADLKIAGSGTITKKLLPSLLSDFADKNGARIDVKNGEGETQYTLISATQGLLRVSLTHENSTSGIGALLDGQANFAFSTRPIDPVERERGRTAGLGDLGAQGQGRVIGYDGLMVVTHPNNLVRAMTEPDLAAIFSGNAASWRDVGGADRPINIYLRESGSAAHDLLDRIVLQPNRVKLTANVVELPSDAAIADAVREDPNGIGLTSIVHQAGTNVLEVEGRCGIRTPASRFTIKTEEYPLSRPIYVYSGQETQSGFAGDFVKYLSSRHAERIIEKAGFISEDIQLASLNDQGLRVAHTVIANQVEEEKIQPMLSMLDILSTATRVSTTIRFRNGSSDLDAVAYDELDRLAEFIKSDDYADSVVYFMGFSDAIGRTDLNQLLALKRAEIVRQAVVSRHPELAERIKARSVGFGEISPLACDETRPGRQINRRVEVWIHNTTGQPVN